MINFVIVEDNPMHMEVTENIIIKYMMKNDYEFKIFKFEGINKEFDKIIEDDKNYIYILDFELVGMTAIDVARKIRKVDWISPIIIFTVNGGMAYETFKQRLQILDFVNKQYQAEKNMFELFDICFEQLKIRKSFKYKVGKIDYSIDYDKILYIYKDTVERKSIIITDNNEYKLSMSLNEIKDKLPKEFKYSHRSCIVNTARVEAFNWTKKEITFDNNKTTDLISKTHKTELMNK